jgi:quercetin dioxygenase-like cupin family protein
MNNYEKEGRMAGKVTHWAEAEAVEMMPGVTRRTLAQTDDMMLLEIRLAANLDFPVHSHPHRQVGYVVSGEVVMTIDGQATVCKPGDGYTIPGGVEHGAATNADTVVIDCFTPPREDYQ